MGLSLRGQTSGAVDINAPDVAGDNTITLPGGNGSANQFYKNSDTAGIITHSSMTESSSGVISIGDIDINGTTRTITTGVGQTVGFGTDIKIQGSVRIEDPSVSATRLSITYEGIDFQNTGAGSSSTATAHLLDDYEEGTFTPTLFGATTAGTYTPATSVGTYTKIGRTVNIHVTLSNITVTSVGSGVLLCGGLPFASSNTGSINFTGSARFDRVQFATDTVYVVPFTSQSQTQIGFQCVKDNDGDIGIQATALQTAVADIFVSISYIVD